MQITVHIGHVIEIYKKVLAIPDYFIDSGALQSRVQTTVHMMNLIVLKIILNGGKILIKCGDQLIISKFRIILKYVGETMRILVLPYNNHMDLVTPPLSGGQDNRAEQKMPDADRYNRENALI